MCRQTWWWWHLTRPCLSFFFGDLCLVCAFGVPVTACFSYVGCLDVWVWIHKSTRACRGLGWCWELCLIALPPHSWVRIYPSSIVPTNMTGVTRELALTLLFKAGIYNLVGSLEIQALVLRILQTLFSFLRQAINSWPFCLSLLHTGIYKSGII